MMDQELKKKWVEALRSGGYAQIRSGDLHTTKGFCCLGVLNVVKGSDPNDLNVYAHFEEDGMPSAEDLWGKNDCEGWTFPQIADYIEENL